MDAESRSHEIEPELPVVPDPELPAAKTRPEPSLGRHLGRFLARLAGGGPDPLLETAVAALTQRLGEGHVCLDLADGAALAELGHPGVGEAWRNALAANPVTGAPGEYRPLILERARLYFHRHWTAEARSAQILARLAQAPFTPLSPRQLGALDRLFPPAEAGGGVNLQRLAAFAAATRRLTVISGGPGTGKTTTLAGVLYLHFLTAPSSRVALAAPSGKAANRMQEAVREAVSRITKTLGETVDPLALERLGQVTGVTLHRLLGLDPATRRARRHAGAPLAADLVAVDEASMVDLALLSSLLEALPPHARLVLLGDKDQLASVEAGAVMGEIAAGFEGNRVTSAFREAYNAGLAEGVFANPRTEAEPAPDGQPPNGRLNASFLGARPDSGALVQLERSHRFEARPGIGRLAGAIRHGAAQDALVDLLKDLRGDEGVTWLIPEPGQALENLVAPFLTEGFAPFLSAGDPASALAALGRFRLLAALREGPFSVAHLNWIAERHLAGSGQVTPRPGFYPGRPVLVTRNSYAMKLFNGDLGLAWADAQGRLRVFFPVVQAPAPEAGSAAGPGGEPAGVRAVAPATLPAHETAFAMTVHKSQGSEFDDVLLVLPDKPHPVVARELVYTGVTRARRRVILVATAAALAAAVAAPIRRASGLAEKLVEIPSEQG